MVTEEAVSRGDMQQVGIPILYSFRVRCRFDDKEGHVVADQLRAVDGDRLIKHLGVLDEDTPVKVLSVLQAMFAV